MILNMFSCISIIFLIKLSLNCSLYFGDLSRFRQIRDDTGFYMGIKGFTGKEDVK